MRTGIVLKKYLLPRNVAFVETIFSAKAIGHEGYKDRHEALFSSSIHAITR